MSSLLYHLHFGLKAIQELHWRHSAIPQASKLS